MPICYMWFKIKNGFKVQTNRYFRVSDYVSAPPENQIDQFQ